MVLDLQWDVLGLLLIVSSNTKLHERFAIIESQRITSHLKWQGSFSFACSRQAKSFVVQDIKRDLIGGRIYPSLGIPDTYILVTCSIALFAPCSGIFAMA